MPESAEVGLYSIALHAIGEDGVTAVAHGGPADVIYETTPPVQNLGANYNGSTGKVALAWSGIPHADYYYVARRPSGGSWAFISPPLAAANYVDEAPPEGTVEYRVHAFGNQLYYKDYTTSSTSSAVSVVTPVVCAISIAPASQSFSSAYGTGSITITASVSCSWTAEPSAPWISIPERRLLGPTAAKRSPSTAARIPTRNRARAPSPSAATSS